MRGGERVDERNDHEARHDEHARETSLTRYAHDQKGQQQAASKNTELSDELNAADCLLDLPWHQVAHARQSGYHPGSLQQHAGRHPEHTREQDRGHDGRPSQRGPEDLGDAGPPHADRATAPTATLATPAGTA